MFGDNDVTMQWLPLPGKFVHKANSYAKIFVSARSLRDLNEVTPPGGRRSRKQ